MFSLSKESEQELAHGVLELVENYLGARDTVKPRLTGLISAQEAMDELDIKYKTLQKWIKSFLTIFLSSDIKTRQAVIL